MIITNYVNYYRFANVRRQTQFTIDNATYLLQNPKILVLFKLDLVFIRDLIE